MDLIAQLAGTLGLEENQAKALAGTVIGGVQNAVADEDPEKAAQIGNAVPELSGWQSAAGSLLGGGEKSGGGGLGGLLGGMTGGGGAGGLLGAAAGAFGGQEAKDTLAVVGILNQFDVDAGKAAMVAPLILNFLKSRVEPGTLSTIIAVAPMLAAVVGGDDGDDSDDKPAGGMLGALGGLLG
ncbi:MAG: hypothetical protein ACI9VR_004048 [Cognaticolwellia sp.]|jgi:hypothetical protein